MVLSTCRVQYVLVLSGLVTANAALDLVTNIYLHKRFMCGRLPSDQKAPLKECEVAERSLRTAFSTASPANGQNGV